MPRSVQIPVPLALALLLATDTAAAVRRTPSGYVNIQRGPFEGRQFFGDDRSKHTKVAEFSVAELREFLRGKATKDQDIRDFVRAVENRDTAYGSQLSSEGCAKYDLLVGDALLNGEVVKNEPGDKRVQNEASFSIGIDVATGKPTGLYCCRFDQKTGGWHLHPGRC